MMTAAPQDRTLIAVLRNAELAAHVKAYCDSAGDIASDIRISPDATAEAPGIVNGGADVVVIEAASHEEAEIAALERLCAYVARGGSFIVIMDDPSASVVRRLFRAGVTDVLPTPVTEGELLAALNTATGARRAASSPPKPSRRGNIAVVLKTAGGVGATTFATNVAAAMQIIVPGGTALVDLDVQFGQIATSLDIAPRMTIVDAIRAGARLDETLLASTMHAHASGLKVLAAPPQVTPLDAVTEPFLDKLFSTLRSSFATSIVELPFAWSLSTGEALSRADAICIISQPTVKCAAGAARIQQGLVDFGIQKPNMALFASHYEKTLETNERMRKIGEVFRVKPLAAIRFDDKTAADAADRGLLISDASPKAPIVKDFEAAARKLSEALGVESSGLVAIPSSAPFGKLFGSLPGRRV
jgi:pilus assembly protein CpaE